MSHRKRHIILIEDDHGPMKYFVEALELEGFVVLQFDDTDTAWKLFDEDSMIEAPDLFVIDIMMPYGSYVGHVESDDGLLTGYFLIKRCLRRFPEIPVVCLTNKSGVEEVETELGSTIKHFSKHDVAPSDFASAIANMLK